MNKKKKPNSIFEYRHFFDKKRFQDIFESPDKVEKASTYLNKITKDIFQTNTKKKSTNTSTVSETSLALKRLKNDFKKPKLTPRHSSHSTSHQPINEMNTTLPPTPKKQPLPKKNKPTIQKKTVISTPSSSEKPAVYTKASLRFSNPFKGILTAIKGKIPSLRSQKKQHHSSSKTMDESLNRLKEREKKIQDLLNKKKGNIS